LVKFAQRFASIGRHLALHGDPDPQAEAMFAVMKFTMLR
jgi:hypothetical protein